MFGKKQAAEVVRNADLTPALLTERIQSILSSSARLLAMAEAVSGFARPRSTQEIVETVIRAAKQTPHQAVEHEGVNI